MCLRFLCVRDFRLGYKTAIEFQPGFTVLIDEPAGSAHGPTQRFGRSRAACGRASVWLGGLARTLTHMALDELGDDVFVDLSGEFLEVEQHKHGSGYALDMCCKFTPKSLH